MNAGNRDPGVRAAIDKVLAEARAEAEEFADCDHRVEYGRIKKFDGGRLPILCGRCSLILEYRR
jgi:hypothetical protein